ncbi:MAG: AAA family ATPase [Synergistaceae bacterium]|jgi:energy-coupling factor transporter ATP-binding protein EcfA2|nr:AAA family ATPase [Synergistaceae bacterium]
MSAVKPKWAREIERFLAIKSQFLLYGNVNDVFPAALGENVATLGMPDYLKELLAARGYVLAVKYEPLVGFSLLHGREELFQKLTREKLPPGGALPATLDKAATLASALTSSAEGHTALILRFASRMTDLLSETDVETFFYRMFRLSIEAAPRMAPAPAGEKDEGGHGGGTGAPLPLPFRGPQYNPVFWIMDKENDLPPWYILDNPRIRVLPIPRPDNEIRSCVVEAVSPKIPGYDDLEEDLRDANLALFRDQTTGLLAGEIAAIAQLAWHERLPFAQIGDAIRRYKLGIQENMWEKLDREKILGAEEFLSRRVMGQGMAVRHASDILKRSRFNLSGAQFSRFSQRPKGILFLAGPTGVGKTELAKAITELIFGSSTHYIRFDMSEFGHEHANQRLVGAPPGYVGYDVGGELTNAIKQNPFSVVLFDEVEKAHPKILDIFLQILDDGRLTSGRGETVYFSESLIVFTSNLGMFEQLPDGTKRQRVAPDMAYEEIASKIGSAIDDFFKYKINRPEILNRIGKNVVVFDFIREETARKIFARMMDNVLFRLEDGYGIRIRFADQALQRIAELVCKDLSMGGRGIGSNLEALFMNPLSRRLCELHEGAGSPEAVYTVRDLRETPQGWVLDVE